MITLQQRQAAAEQAAPIRERIEAIRYELSKPVQSQFIKSDCEELLGYVDALVARCELLQQEKYAWVRQSVTGDIAVSNAVQRADRLAAALREIRMCSDDERVIRIARAALAEEPT